MKLRALLRHLWENEDGFFGIGAGPSSAQIADAGALGSIAGFATSEGESDIMSSDKFWQAILSGDPGQIAKVMGPAMSAANKQSQQANMTAAQFGNRSGGTNAGAASRSDTTRSQIDEMISKLTGSAAGALGSSGSGLLGTGLSARNDKLSADTTIHNEKEAKWNDIFSSAASLATAPFTGGASLGGLAKPAASGVTGSMSGDSLTGYSGASNPWLDDSGGGNGTQDFNL